VTHLREEKEMKYTLLIYPGATREAIGQLTEDGQTAVMSEYRALAEESGVFGTEQLHPADTATTVRVEDGRTLTTDGAFANEDIGRIYLLEADDLDRALEFAERIPAARLGRHGRGTPNRGAVTRPSERGKGETSLRLAAGSRARLPAKTDRCGTARSSHS
jgi:hypothetical protein